MATVAARCRRVDPWRLVGHRRRARRWSVDPARPRDRLLGCVRALAAAAGRRGVGGRRRSAGPGGGRRPRRRRRPSAAAPVMAAAAAASRRDRRPERRRRRAQAGHRADRPVFRPGRAVRRRNALPIRALGQRGADVGGADGGATDQRGGAPTVAADRRGGHDLGPGGRGEPVSGHALADRRPRRMAGRWGAARRAQRDRAARPGAAAGTPARGSSGRQAEHLQRYRAGAAGGTGLRVALRAPHPPADMHSAAAGEPLAHRFPRPRTPCGRSSSSSSHRSQPVLR
jgi:hypothetical protein